ncbi:MAG: alpha/beta hydrolase [Polyangiales bacterium]|nr:alpha/beta hydrolase [Myxococcales bacterium]MCB9659428.1 alpha/beta hydrolase [Sandaracinaceae bacterium]
MARTYTPDPDTITLHANGIDFACLSWGEGPLVVLVHGFPDTARTWDLVGPRIAALGFRVLAPYTRGIAPSSAPADGDYASDTLGRDILALIEAAGEQQAIVVGHDFGASAAYSAAGLGSDKVRKLVTVAIPHPASIKPSLGKVWKVRHFMTHRLPGAAKRFAANDFAELRVLYERWSPGFAWPDAEFEAAKNSYSAPGGTQRALDYYKFITPKPPAGHLVRLPMPSLVIGGHTDGAMKAEDFEGCKGRFTGPIEVAMVPGGHFLHREHPEEFLAVLLPFLKEGA